MNNCQNLKCSVSRRALLHDGNVSVLLLNIFSFSFYAHCPFKTLVAMATRNQKLVSRIAPCFSPAGAYMIGTVVHRPSSIFSNDFFLSYYNSRLSFCYQQNFVPGAGVSALAGRLPVICQLKLVIKTRRRFMWVSQLHV